MSELGADSASAAAGRSEAMRRALADHGYLADRGLATALAIAVEIEKPLLLEGDAGVGKTALAKALAESLGAPLIRLQCYEGIDASHALYDWDYARQMLYIRTLEAGGSGAPPLADVFSEQFLIERPLLKALRHRGEERPVLLIDELDRADDEFEAFLLELLSDFQVTVPEIGTITALRRPLVVITSNRTRELHDALKRRCLYHWLEHPDPRREAEILMLKVEGLEAEVAGQVTRFVAAIRRLDLIKVPGVAETIDWVRGMRALGAESLEAERVGDSLGLLLKNQEDIETVLTHGVDGLIALSLPSGGDG